jgi:hypothetical protein
MRRIKVLLFNVMIMPFSSLMVLFIVLHERLWKKNYEFPAQRIMDVSTKYTKAIQRLGTLFWLAIAYVCYVYPIVFHTIMTIVAIGLVISLVFYPEAWQGFFYGEQLANDVSEKVARDIGEQNGNQNPYLKGSYESLLYNKLFTIISGNTHEGDLSDAGSLAETHFQEYGVNKNPFSVGSPFYYAYEKALDNARNNIQGE